MMTVQGARAIGVDPRLASLEPDATPAGLAVLATEGNDPESMLQEALQNRRICRCLPF